MKEIKLDEKYEKKISEQITKIIKSKTRKRIVTYILLLIFALVITELFSKIGAKLDMEFVFGQLCIFVVYVVANLYNSLLEKEFYSEIDNFLFNDDEISKKINDEINKYKEENQKEG